MIQSHRDYRKDAKTLRKFFLLPRTFAPLRLIFSSILLLLFSSTIYAQDRLSLQDAIGIALKNNYSILISENNYEVTKNNNSAGNAGMMPSVGAVAATGQTINNLKLIRADGTETDKNSASTTTTTAGIVLNWTLFNGARMFATKERLAELEAKGDVTFKLQIETTVQQIITGYFNVTQQQKLLDAININISIDSERVVIAQTKLEVGSGSRLDLLQAKVDLNEQISARMTQQALLQDSKDQLNYLLSRKPTDALLLSDSIVITYHPSPDSLYKTVPENNYTIRSAIYDQRISAISLREAQSFRSPEIDFTAGYNYSRVNSQAGLLLLNQNLGFNYGFNFSWNLFNGFNTSRQIKNARINYENSKFTLSDVKLQVNTELEKAIRNFTNNLAILQLEQENILLASENLNIALERYRSGLSIALELQQAQKSFQDGDTRLVQAQYNAKLSETELLRLNGELVK